MVHSSKFIAGLIAFAVLGTAACGGVASRTGRAATSVPARVTPTSSSATNTPASAAAGNAPGSPAVRNGPASSSACNLQMAYQGGSVVLYFDAPRTDCTTIQKDVAGIGSPFNASLTPMGSIDIAAMTPLCLKSNFAANGVVIANQLVALVQRGQGGSAGAAFCTAWVGHLGKA